MLHMLHMYILFSNIGLTYLTNKTYTLDGKLQTSEFLYFVTNRLL